MKGFDAIALAMIPSFKAAALRRPIHILLSYDEETTCEGSLDVIRRFGKDIPRPGAVIVGEPTMMEIADAHKSIATFRTTVTGVEAHSAKPSLGANAVACACDIVSEIYRLARTYEAPDRLDPRFDPPYSTLHVGTIVGGSARNILARECKFHWEFRGLPGVPTMEALGLVESWIDRVGLPRLTRFVSGPKVETIVEADVPGLAAEPGSNAETLVMKIARANRTHAVSFATEAGQFQAAGLPTVVCGPGSIDQAHKPDEFLEDFADRGVHRLHAAPGGGAVGLGAMRVGQRRNWMDAHAMRASDAVRTLTPDSPIWRSCSQMAPSNALDCAIWPCGATKPGRSRSI